MLIYSCKILLDTSGVQRVWLGTARIRQVATEVSKLYLESSGKNLSTRTPAVGEPFADPVKLCSALIIGKFERACLVILLRYSRLLQGATPGSTHCLRDGSNIWFTFSTVVLLGHIYSRFLKRACLKIQVLLIFKWLPEHHLEVIHPHISRSIYCNSPLR